MAVANVQCGACSSVAVGRRSAEQGEGWSQRHTTQRWVARGWKLPNRTAQQRRLPAEPTCAGWLRSVTGQTIIHSNGPHTCSWDGAMRHAARSVTHRQRLHATGPSGDD